MNKDNPPRQRVFKTVWFSKAVRKVRIADSALCEAVYQAMQGRADDLGGGVFKKRLHDNLYRSVIIAKAGRHWVFEYLFAKQDRANIEPDELAGFRALAKVYAGLTTQQVEQLLRDKDWMEICHDQDEIQK